MKKQLLIVFVKNSILGKVKTRLAKTIGDQNALAIYKELLAITENAIASINCDKVIYFSDAIEKEDWQNCSKNVQFGVDLGAKMKNAFLDGFNSEYESILLIGSDLPEISKTIIENGFNELEKNEVVFGPAQDGGYYLIGMTKIYNSIFESKPWSQPNLLNITLNELNQNNTDFSLLETLNDIDTYEDLITSDFYKNNIELHKYTKKNNHIET